MVDAPRFSSGHLPVCAVSDAATGRGSEVLVSGQTLWIPRAYDTSRIPLPRTEL